ncbi:hypothetical protein APICC_02386 [Apis cerana cerana]|uniref:Uncharacterized protein n=1 Tax=Apis cerana cerana TaxID=94128 RepID=A0A2A3ESI5_APICC|nr:hypothetical protein APICC_02386 [Apis cerana cerana]
MSGVSCVETEPRYSAPWYPNIDVALMGIQSTAQFVEKYHHIIVLSDASFKDRITNVNTGGIGNWAIDDRQLMINQDLSGLQGRNFEN